MKVLLLISEKILYELSHYVIVASQWLAKILPQHFGPRNNIVIIENATSYIFEKLVHELTKRFKPVMLRRYVCEKLLQRSECPDKLILVAPLPSIFKSNVLAYKKLLSSKILQNPNVIIAVTGIGSTEERDFQGNVIRVGYLSYVNYVALLMASDGVILPYPNSAICGGIRNKVLEAGFCRKLVMSTKVGIMHFKALPTVHYVLIDTVLKSEKADSLECYEHYTKYWKSIAEKFYEVVVNQYSFQIFKKYLLTFVKTILVKKELLYCEFKRR
jgi:glycosyltransferase involved in cell wall biosynthesis